MSDTMNKKYLIIILLIPLIMSAVYGHGVDVTADTMVIADETNGQLAKDITDSNGMNISVYKFTSQADVEHILEHSVNNTNKRILMIAYQDSGNEFLKKHSEVSDRVIVVDDVNNDTIEDGLNKIMNAPTQNEESQSSFAVPLFIGLIIGILVGAPIGVLLMKRKNKE